MVNHKPSYIALDSTVSDIILSEVQHALLSIFGFTDHKVYLSITITLLKEYISSVSALLPDHIKQEINMFYFCCFTTN